MAQAKRLQDQEMVVFTRTFDFLTWLLPMTESLVRDGSLSVLVFDVLDAL